MPGVPDTPPPRIRALVVDDHRDSAESLARVLQAMNCEATFITNSALAMEKMIQCQPDIVFLDLDMPPPDGYVVARLIRSNFPNRRIRIVAMTGFGSADDRAKSRYAGFDAHLLKPVSQDLIDAVLKELL